MNWPYIDSPEPEAAVPEPQTLAPEPPVQEEATQEAVEQQSSAEIYEALFSEVTDRAIEPLLDAAGVSFGTRLLDVACGPGHLLGEAVRRGAHANGIDLSPAMVALARNAHPNLDVREGNAEAMPYSVGSFDAVTCSFGLGHFAEPERVMAEFTRVLVPYGIAAVSWWDAWSRNRINGMFHEAIGKLAVNVPPGPSFDQFSDREQLTALMQAAGLQSVRIEDVIFRQTVRDMTELWAMAMGSFARASAAITAQPEEVQKAIRDAVEEAAQPYLTPEGFRIPVVFMVAAGVKP